MAGTAFLTDRRREFLSGDYDLDDSKDRQLKRRTVNDAQAALAELIEVAQSPHLDNTEVFDPDELGQLVQALLLPDPQHVSSGGLVEATDDDLPTATTSEEFQQFRDRLYVVIDRPMHGYRDSRFPDPEE